jgi:hypothetical protein
MTTLKTGGDIDAPCSRCQLELAHIIVAMVHGQVKRVQCKTCRTEHAYKAPAKSGRASASAPRQRAARSSRAGGASAKRSTYEDLVSGHDISRAQKYRPATTYDEGDVINHPSFGLGVVTRALSDGKVDVLFPTGSKVLVHARG